MIESSNFKKISLQYLFIINVFLIMLTSQPFVFSISFSVIFRYGAILSFFLLASLHSGFWKHKITNPLFYLLFLTCVVFSALLSENYNIRGSVNETKNGYSILIINFFIFIVLVHMLSSIERLGEKLKTLFVSLCVCYALIAIVGFLCVNYLGVSVERIQLYQIFGHADMFKNLQFSMHEACYRCVIVNEEMYNPGYRYNFSKYFGFFASINLIKGASILRYVGFAFEPSLTALIFLLAIVVLDDLYWLSISIRRVMLCALIGGGISTISLTFFTIIFLYLVIMTFLSLKKNIYKIIFLSLLFLSFIIISNIVLKSGSVSMRIHNIIDVYNYMLFNFTTVDYLFGRGALWFSGIHGINSGYLSIFSQFGVLITLLFIFLWVNASKYSIKAQTLFFFCPFVLNIQTSILYFIVIALLSYRNEEI